MKLLLITHSYGLNGAALLLRDVAEHWIKNNGWHVDALISENQLAENGKLLNDIGVKTLTNIDLENHKYDLAIINTIIDIAYVEKINKAMPVLLWIHEGSTILLNWDIPVSQLTNNFTKFEKIIFQTKWQSENVFKSFLNYVPNNKLHYLPSAVEISDKYTKENYEINSKIKIITVGSVYARKRQMDLIAAIDRLIEKNYQIECTVIGDYSEAGDWKTRISNDNKNPNSYIKWIGPLKDKKMIFQKLRESDMASFPSGDESHPLSLLEAASVGLPMIITNLPPYNYIGWENGKNCLFHNIGSIDEIVIQIEKLINDKNMRMRIGKNANKLVIRKYNKIWFYEKMDKIIGC
jgi:glycosyltransferase involved in cell wall biosynthesis